jgi:hypothetical protein
MASQRSRLLGAAADLDALEPVDRRQDLPVVILAVTVGLNSAGSSGGPFISVPLCANTGIISNLRRQLGQ